MLTSLFCGCFDFYPRSPCGERPVLSLSFGAVWIISIHALLAESDNLRVVDGSKSSIISIHALLAESDANRAELNIRQIHFYPRSPCGERQFSYFLHIHRLLFLSTLSLRRATAQIAPFFRNNRNFYPRSPCGERRTSVVSSAGTTGISIHALLAESDVNRAIDVVESRQFLSTLSLRRATE